MGGDLPPIVQELFLHMLNEVKHSPPAVLVQEKPMDQYPAKSCVKGICAKKWAVGGMGLCTFG
jgi:hypothetical protein